MARRVFSAAGKRAGLVYGHDYCKTAKCRYISHGQGVGVHKSNLHKSAFYSGLVTCGRVWDCPVCGPKIQERRREEIASAVKWAYDKGLQPVMVTLTFPHYSWNKLSVLLKQQAFALQRLRAGAPWKRFKEAIGYEGLIRSLENLFGLNGWHPHTHELWFVRGDADAEAMKVEVLKRWESACIRAGLLDQRMKPSLKHSAPMQWTLRAIALRLTTSQSRTIPGIGAWIEKSQRPAQRTVELRACTRSRSWLKRGRGQARRALVPGLLHGNERQEPALLVTGAERCRWRQ